MSAFADIADHSCRIPYHQCVTGYIACNYTPSRHHRVLADLNSAEHSGICSDTNALPDQGRRNLPFLIECARNLVISKGNARPYKDIVVYSYAMIDGHAILNLAPVTNTNSMIDVDVLGKDAIIPDNRVLPNLNVYPNLAAITYLGTIRDMRTLMNECFIVHLIPALKLLV